MKRKISELEIVLIPLAIGINIGIGVLIKLLNLPFYLDAIGTILITLTMGLRAGLISGILSFALMTILGLNPFAIYFVGTQAAIAVYVHLVAKIKGYKSLFTTLLSGIGLGIVAAMISAPVIVAVFGGVEGNGPGLIVAYLVKTGKTIVDSVVLKGLSIEPIDKTIQTFLAIFIIKAIPRTILKRMNSEVLLGNRLL
jgi:energy-coupling factor transport system substrate-specific component